MENQRKRFDRKLEQIRNDPSGSTEFIIADAKDADMAFGITAPGPVSHKISNAEGQEEGPWKTLKDYRNQIRDIIRQDVVDIVLLSASNVEQLAIKESLFENSGITPAARANDTSDIWKVRGENYSEHPSRPFHSATIDHIKYGQLNEDHLKPVVGAELGLYSITFNNDIAHDHRSLEEFHAFRLEAEKKHFRYFLEVFNPNIDPCFGSQQFGSFLNDHIVRCLAGVTEVGRPLFLKIPYNGPRSLEELVAYDPSLIVGILGGSAGTTMDAFKLIHDARKYGARAALFGRKINLSEEPLTFIEFLKKIVDGDLAPKEAVKAYHNELNRRKIEPMRHLAQDLEITDPVLIEE